MKIRLAGTLLIILALLLLPFPITAAAVEAADPFIELTDNRTATSKLYYLGLSQDGRKRYALDVSTGGPVHYKDAAGMWQDIDTTSAEADSGNYTLKFTKLPYVVRIGNDSGRRIYPDRNDLSYWIDIGKPFPSMGAPTRDGNRFTWDFTNATLIVTLGTGVAKFDAILKNSSAPSTLTIPFTTTGIVRDGNKLLHNGKVVAILSKPFAVDATGIERDVSVSFGTGEITLSLDTTGLTYPVRIDPTIDVSVGASADDASERQNDGLVNLTSLYTLFISDPLAGVRWKSGFRFLAAVPIGATINTVYLTLYTTSTTYDDFNGAIYVEKAAGPVTFGSGAWDITNRTETTASTPWVQDGTGTGPFNSPDFKIPLQEVVDLYSTTAIVVILAPNSDVAKTARIVAYDNGSNYAALHIEYTEGGPSAPTVTTSAATNVEATTATGSGNITATGGENATIRGFQWGTSTGVYSTNVTESGSFGTGVYSLSLTSLPTGTTIYHRAEAYNSGGWGYGSELTFLTKPAAPTGVTATDGSSTANVTVSWNASTGATDYHVWRDGLDLGATGNVTSYVDTGATAPTITAGIATASNGTSTTVVVLSAAGESANNGVTHTYKVVASNASGNSADSATDTGYRGVGTLTYQWQRSAADSDAAYGNIAGATTDPYSDAGGVTAPDGRYYKAIFDATGATQNSTAGDRGWMAIPGALVQPPTSFVVLDGGGNTGLGSWVTGLFATDTVIRMRRDRFPTSLTDGELVFSGNLTSANFTGLDMEINTYYFSAWGYDSASGLYSVNKATTSVGGTMLLFFGLLVLALGLTIAMFIARQIMLGWPSGIFWFIFGAYCYTQSTATWDIYYLLFFASSFGMTLFCVFAAFALRSGDIVEPEEPAEDSGDSGGDGGMSSGDGGGGRLTGHKKHDRRDIRDNKPEFDHSFFEEGIGNYQPSKYTQGLRDRASQRRTQQTTKTRKGEFRW